MKKWIGLFVAALVALPGPAWSEATPDAKKWLDTMAALYDKAPLSADFELTLGAASGLPVSGTAHGTLILKDRKHQRVEMKMAMGGGGGGGQSLQIELLTVSDGTSSWTEMNMGGGKQVIKFSLDDAEKMSAGGGMGMGMSAMDPISQIEHLTKAMDVELVTVAGGEVTLSAKMTEEAKASLGNSPVPVDSDLTIVLDEKTGHPLRMTFGGVEQPMMKLETTRFEFVDESELPAGAFSYTPPEGVQVMDGSQLMGMRGQPGNRQ